jgi:hypothetical protein
LNLISKKGKAMKYFSTAFIREMMKRALVGEKGNKWEIICKWLIACGISAHVIVVIFAIISIV